MQELSGFIAELGRISPQQSVDAILTRFTDFVEENKGDAFELQLFVDGVRSNKAVLAFVAANIPDMAPAFLGVPTEPVEVVPPQGTVLYPETTTDPEGADPPNQYPMDSQQNPEGADPEGAETTTDPF